MGGQKIKPAAPHTSVYQLRIYTGCTRSTKQQNGERLLSSPTANLPTTLYENM